MNPDHAEPLRIAQPAPADTARAMALALSYLSPADKGGQIAAWSDAVQTGQAVVWAGYRGYKAVAAIIVQPQAGRTAVLLVPRVADGEPAETARWLLAGVLDELRRQGTVLAQVLLEVDHGADAELVSAGGFHHAADLLYLVSVAGAFPTSPPLDGLEFVSSAASNDARLFRIMEQTYEGSLDCPQLDRVRSIEDVVTGYRGVGVFNPAGWMIVRHQARDVGCLLIADQPRSNACELVYLGVVPPARGRGFGVGMARFAQWYARQAGRERLIAAVDAANWPAMAVYAAAGFVTWDKRSVFLRVF
jgi:ribosomal protein S18 acetylase RimI-like enzyme